GRRPTAETLATKLLGLRFQKKGPAARQLVEERFRRHDLAVRLPADRRAETIVEDITDAQLLGRSRVQGQRRALLADNDRLGDAPHRVPGALERDPGTAQGPYEAQRRAVQARRLRSV